MGKARLILFLGIVVILIATFSILPGCKTTQETTATSAETTMAQETTTAAGETTAAETTTAAGGTTYEDFRTMAEARKYENEPAKGHTLAFANLLKAYPFCLQVEDGIKEEWKLAGGADADLTVLDNAADTSISVQNSDIIFNKNPDVFVEFQADAKTNTMIGRKATMLGVFLIGVDVPIPGFPFMGTDNYNAGFIMGQWAVEQIDKVFGGWENVDLVLYYWQPAVGDIVAQRTLASIDPMKEKFGNEADPNFEGEKKAIIVDSGNGTEDDIKKSTTAILAKYPKAQNIVVFSMHDDGSSAIEAAAEMTGRWDPDKWLLCSQGVTGENAYKMIRDGIIDGSCAYFPERYARYIIPGALAHMYGNPVPPNMFVDNVIITKDNIDQYYPQK